MPLTSPDPQQRHIDCVRPEVLVLGALLIANKFLDDTQTPTSVYQGYVAEGRWTCHQINVTEQCILENLGWRIKPLWDDDLIADALDDMRRAGTLANSKRQSAAFTHLKMLQEKMFNDGTVWSAQAQITPAESPVASRAG